MASDLTTHTCPGGCGRDGIAQNRLACATCWYRLPRDIQNKIWRSYGRNQARHLAAKAEAYRWYRQNPLPL